MEVFSKNFEADRIKKITELRPQIKITNSISSLGLKPAEIIACNLCDIVFIWKLNTKNSQKTMPLKYLALGDSYTIGESVPKAKSFPYQLAAKLNLAGIEMFPPEITATTGWTTDELIKAINEKNLREKFDLVTLLIGVNNQYRGYSKGNYRKEFRDLLKAALCFADQKKSHVMVISIPDWGLTPFALKSGRDIQKVSTQIKAFNLINEQEAIKAHVGYLDISKTSAITATDLSFFSNDGLHPSEKLYDLWADELAKMLSSKFIQAS